MVVLQILCVKRNSTPVKDLAIMHVYKVAKYDEYTVASLKRLYEAGMTSRGRLCTHLHDGTKSLMNELRKREWVVDEIQLSSSWKLKEYLEKNTTSAQ